jgi:DNA-binding CsgD family transcriptional regulator
MAWCTCTIGWCEPSLWRAGPRWIIGDVASRVSSPELIGRGAELTALEAAVERAAERAPSVVVIAGESGVGKSRLVNALAERVALGGGLALTGECIELSEGEIPFAPVVSALRRLARDLDDDQLDTVFGEASSEMIRLFPELARGAIPGSESLGLGSVGQARLFEFLLGIFQRLAEQQPLTQLVAAVGDDEQEALVAHAREEEQQVPCGAIGPMHVLDHDRTQHTTSRAPCARRSRPAWRAKRSTPTPLRARARAVGLGRRRGDLLDERRHAELRQGATRAAELAYASDAPAERANELGLTGRELEVLALVTQGRTNREIGERLYMSEKTASVHVSRILGKLGASNRAEAAASAERLGLVR